ncbi:hypothetical protein Patl1_20678 [Pistacia atlantica]|uniref:Uncharacterized protein n=1 Tax=Pistacia atlantica TaxID=434234 RepID=A0ACC1BKF4_9ROSI|nr:hypothetical protein Patl1_20678 [Pistacia atlantica]
MMQTTKGLLAQTPNSMDACDFTALEIPPVLLQCGKTDMEVKNTPPRAWALKATDVVEKTFQWWHHQPNLSNTQTMKDHKLLSNSHHLLLRTDIYTVSNCKLACSIKDVKMQSGRRLQL